MARSLFVAALALLLAAQVVRTAIVSAIAPTNPAAAARVWPNHPDVELSVGMTAIGDATRQRKPVGDSIFSTIDDAAAKAPLAPEPFLVRGVQAQLAGKTDTARRAFLAAEWRDPRSLPARYFLADDYFRSGDVQRGLSEFAALARLAPNGGTSVAPYIATYGRDRANWPQLRALFRSNPGLEEPALKALATEPASADAILALADPKRRNSRSLWLPSLLATLVGAGQYEKARTIWAEIAGVRLDPRQLLYDPQFADREAPPPFNWALTSSTVGLAERQPQGRLHVIYYGQEDGELAKQLLMLAPGRYRMAMHATGERSQLRSLSWSMTCGQSRDPFATFGLNSDPERGWVFNVPAGCPAQNLALVGASSDIPQQTDITISGLSLARESANE